MPARRLSARRDAEARARAALHGWVDQAIAPRALPMSTIAALHAAVTEARAAFPGLSLVLAGEAALPVLTFPGNLGDDDSLRQAWMRMESGAPPSGDQP